MSRICIILAIVAIPWAPVAVWGCDLCVVGNPLQPTLADEVSAASDVALAGATGEPDRFEIQSVIKGEATMKGSRVHVPGINHEGRVLLSRAAADAPWKGLGAWGIHHIVFFKVVLGLPATKPATDAEWNERLAHFRPYLGHPDPRLARSALMEWARAPYRVLKAQQVDGEQLRTWLLNPMQADAKQMMNVVLNAFGSAAAPPINEHVRVARTASGSAAKTP